MIIEIKIAPNEIETADMSRHQRKLAREIVASHPDVRHILFARRGGNAKAADLMGPHDYLYVMASGGAWGRSKERFVGRALVASAQERQRIRTTPPL